MWCIPKTSCGGTLFFTLVATNSEVKTRLVNTLGFYLRINVLRGTCELDGSQVKRPIVVFLAIMFPLSMEIGGERMSHFLGYHHIRMVEVDLKLYPNRWILWRVVGDYSEHGGSIVQRREHRRWLKSAIHLKKFPQLFQVSINTKQRNDSLTFSWSSCARSLKIVGTEFPSLIPDGIVWLYMWNSPYITLAVVHVLISWQA